MATTKSRPRPADRRVHYPDAVDPDWMRPKGLGGPEQFHLRGTEHDHDQSTHAGGRGGSIGALVTGDMDQARARQLIDDTFVPRRKLAIERAVAWDAENPTAASWEVTEITEAVEYVRRYRDASRISEVDDRYKDWWAADHGDERRLNKWARDFAASAVTYDDADPEARQVIADAMDVVATNPAIRSAVDAWGPVGWVRVVGRRNMTDSMGSHQDNGIVIADTLTRSREFELEMNVGGDVIDRSITGVLRHEYGHHVDNAARVARHPAIERFDAALAEWQPGGGTGSIQTMDQYRRAREIGGDQLSLYARKNAAEAFAETFTKVTHPNYDPDLTPPGPAREMELAMLDIIDPEKRP